MQCRTERERLMHVALTALHCRAKQEIQLREQQQMCAQLKEQLQQQLQLQQMLYNRHQTELTDQEARHQGLLHHTKQTALRHLEDEKASIASLFRLELQNMLAEREEAKEQEAATKTHLTALSHELNHLKSVTLLCELDELRTEHARRMSELKESVEEMGKTKASLAAELRRLSRVEEGAGRLSLEVETLKGLLRDAQGHVARLGEERARMEEDIRAGQAALEEAAKTVVAAQEEQMKEVEARLQEAEGAKREVAAVRERERRWECATEQMKRERETDREGERGREQLLREGEWARARAEEELSRLRALVARMEEERAKEEAEGTRLSCMEDEAARLSVEMERLRGLLFEAQGHVARLEQERARLEEEVRAGQAAREVYEEDTKTFAAQGERIEQLQERVGMLEEERASARQAVEGAEAKAAGLAELKDNLGASLKAKTQEQIECIERLEQVAKDKEALQGWAAAMREGEGAAMQALSAQVVYCLFKSMYIIP